jgi:hypothetical protein
VRCPVLALVLPSNAQAKREEAPIASKSPNVSLPPGQHGALFSLHEFAWQFHHHFSVASLVLFSFCNKATPGWSKKKGNVANRVCSCYGLAHSSRDPLPISSFLSPALPANQPPTGLALAHYIEHLSGWLRLPAKGDDDLRYYSNCTSKVVVVPCFLLYERVHDFFFVKRTKNKGASIHSQKSSNTTYNFTYLN